MFKKCYVADLVDDKGLFSGSVIVRVWFNASAKTAHDAIANAAGAGLYTHNFRRVK